MSDNSGYKYGPCTPPWEQKQDSLGGAFKFWIVWQPCSGNPKIRHTSECKAQEEARRLAAANPSMTFYVLEVKSISSASAVTTTRIN